jgi:hypothetical protein
MPSTVLSLREQGPATKRAGPNSFCLGAIGRGPVYRANRRVAFIRCTLSPAR